MYRLMRVTRDLPGDTMDPTRQQGQTGGVLTKRKERTADLPNVQHTAKGKTTRKCSLRDRKLRNDIHISIVWMAQCSSSGVAKLTSCVQLSAVPVYCTISTVSSVTRNSHKKSPRFKSLEFKRKFIGHLGQQIFRIRELMVEMVQ
jgi:hypothetical protein